MKIHFIAALIFLTATTSFASWKHRGGGHISICPNGLHFVDTFDQSKIISDFFTSRQKQHFNSYYFGMLNQFFDKMEQYIVFDKDHVKSHPVGSDIANDKNCYTRQIATNEIPNQLVFVDPDYYAKLDYYNRLSFLIHEFWLLNIGKRRNLQLSVQLLTEISMNNLTLEIISQIESNLIDNSGMFESFYLINLNEITKLKQKLKDYEYKIHTKILKAHNITCDLKNYRSCYKELSKISLKQMDVYFYLYIHRNKFYNTVKTLFKCDNYTKPNYFMRCMNHSNSFQDFLNGME